MKRVAFLLIVLMMITSCVHAESFTVLVTFDAPTTNQDGSPLTDLSGFMIYAGQSEGMATQSMNIGTATEYLWTLDVNPGSTWWFSASAFDTSGNDSGFSNWVSFTFPVVNLAPSPPTNLHIVIQ